MSSYLTIRKRGKTLCSFSRNSEFYSALESQVVFDKWTACTDTELHRGLAVLDEEIESYEKSIKREERALEYLKTTEDIYNALGTIDSMKETIEEKVEASAYIRFLLMIYENDSEELEWSIG